MCIRDSISSVGDEQVSLILTGIPSGDFLSFENASLEAVGARNIDGTVYVISLAEVDINGDGSIGVDEYLRLKVDNNYGTDTNRSGVRQGTREIGEAYAGREYFA